MKSFQDGRIKISEFLLRVINAELGGGGFERWKLEDRLVGRGETFVIRNRDGWDGNGDGDMEKTATLDSLSADCWISGYCCEVQLLAQKIFNFLDRPAGGQRWRAAKIGQRKRQVSCSTTRDCVCSRITIAQPGWGKPRIIYTRTDPEWHQNTPLPPLPVKNYKQFWFGDSGDGFASNPHADILYCIAYSHARISS